ncbi:flagellar basal-body rod protein FlgF [Verminephrobacter eiseniae]|uniref:flagellar basal-body rod protein FlgF n=1 Tax=Verminephrobacter eiseniae TaxID=364317 RepID=UPI002237131F|nr:flagellar basal-body rod protein FlgF [Verminephrobacter eiseniae]MCW5233383.1 flagellar basal-body rod protein FlgF [Verminephrobacter eiseniae]MCW5295064.1 flagellar basal-body rod protein FlgF [Verminephrobacter eiseniae]MCW8185083.1 flagellar basal-body rod protein FlgF [Verminephrobacter eiseniae]MCW8223785.1 flagellar basal-body rod protein FlgF [Verminephrobacter eiseniae]MCW8234890.1 flagellar basal-body rod protein FlgF [Verminephrobacter eiseniae]
MDHIIYTTMTGAGAATYRQAVLANNLANISTGGFRAQLSTFRSVPLQGDGAKTRVFALEATSGYDDSAGPVQHTGRNLDALAAGRAWFAVQGPDGTEAYTRAGSFELSPTGQLLTPGGLPVLSDAGTPIDLPPGADITLGADGSISAKVAGQPAQTVGRLKLATPGAEDPLQRGGDGLFRTASGEPLPSDANARMLAGALEGSNVNPVECMVGMIAAARQFEQQMQLLQTAQTNDKSASRLLGVND